MGGVKLITALTSWATVIGLIPMIPRALALRSPAELQMEIDERKRVEETLARQARLLEVTHDSILVRDMDGKITFWNHGAEVLYGWTRGEALGERRPRPPADPVPRAAGGDRGPSSSARGIGKGSWSIPGATAVGW